MQNDEIKNASPHGSNTMLGEVFVCDDCGKTLPIRERCDEDYNVCRDCLNDYYENKTGYCSAHCRISGSCDGSC
jgi:hypothetical protein